MQIQAQNPAYPTPQKKFSNNKNCVSFGAASMNQIAKTMKNDINPKVREAYQAMQETQLNYFKAFFNNVLSLFDKKELNPELATQLNCAAKNVLNTEFQSPQAIKHWFLNSNGVKFIGMEEPQRELSEGRKLLKLPKNEKDISGFDFIFNNNGSEETVRILDNKGIIYDVHKKSGKLSESMTENYKELIGKDAIKGTPGFYLDSNRLFGKSKEFSWFNFGWEFMNLAKVKTYLENTSQSAKNFNEWLSK